LAAAGADVIVHGRRKMWPKSWWVNSKKPASNLNSSWPIFFWRKPEQCRQLVEQAWQTWNGLDIWINNAGADILTGAAAPLAVERKLDPAARRRFEATVVLSEKLAGS